MFCREIVDSKCYSLSYEFLCQLLQPVCFRDRLVLPCRDFCHEFLSECANVMPNHLLDRIDCQTFAEESDGKGACISKPGINIFVAIIEYKLVLFYYYKKSLTNFSYGKKVISKGFYELEIFLF
jgi:hypothetical protein